MTRVLGAKARSVWVVAMASVLVFAACAKNSSSGSGSGGTPAQGGSVQVATGSASGVGKVLVDTSGMTLYHLKTETNGTIMCTGSCAGTWPPLLLPSGVTAASAGSGATGTLGTIQRPDGGTQVTYNGLPLYTYSGDTSAGQANGQGIQGVWFAVTPSTAGSGGGTGGAGGYGAY